MFEFLIQALGAPGPTWVGVGIGIVAAGVAWYFLPESTDRAAIGGWLIGAGFVFGLIWAAVPEKKQ
jgi:hypothetical protein